MQKSGLLLVVSGALIVIGLVLLVLGNQIILEGISQGSGQIKFKSSTYSFRGNLTQKIHQYRYICSADN